jgi:ATP-dependent Clp protease ATP-binding subunit ClpB
MGHQTTEEENYQSSVRKMLPPELVSRIDEIIVFNTLKKDSVCKIFNSKINDIIKNLKSKNIELKINVTADNLIDFKKESQDHAREIKKLIRQKIEIPLAKFIMKNSKNKEFEVKMLDGSLTIC